MSGFGFIRDKAIRNFSRTFKLYSNSAHIFIAGPRSASNHICTILEAGTGVSRVCLRTEPGIGHFSVESKKRPPKGSQFIWYQHLYPSPRNIRLVSKFAISNPLISFRNPQSWVLSIAECCVRNRSPWGIKHDSSTIENYVANSNLSEKVSSSRTTNEIELSATIDFVIDYELPTYLRFLSGWLAASEQELKPIRPYFSNYDEYFEDPSVLLGWLSNNWPNFSVTLAKGAIENKQNFNVGRDRNPLNFLEKEQIKRISQLVDFSPAKCLFDSVL
jgi:hypothetical protein